MYDTIEMSLTQGEDLQYDYHEIVDNLEDVYQKGVNIIGAYANGKIGPLFFFISPFYINLYKGSIAKYWLQTNAVEMTRKDILNALNSVSDKLGVDLTKARVTQFDFGGNFETTQSPIRLFDTLGNAQGYTRLEQDNGLYYKRGNMSMVFYDKGLEQRKKKQSLPPLYKNRFLARYEIRVKKVRDVFGVVLGKDLSEEDFYVGVYDLWYKEFRKINIVHAPGSDLVITGSSKNLLERVLLA